ncbi:MAG: hypothetical protein LBD23_19440 [Oscillospiraceae bacterium]|nr:hypothetical protein [Oscillospiraceae bacterium]
MGTNIHEDRLVGVFITTKHIDLFDFDSYLKDNIKNFRNGEIIIDEHSTVYNERLYATQVTKTLTSEDTGETIQTEEFIFEGIDGISFFSVTVPADTEGQESYIASVFDDAINGGQLHVTSGDDESNIKLDGTIYVVPKVDMDLVFYINLVYQSLDGSVYLLSGSGISTSGAVDEGTVMSQSFTAVYTTNENGRTKTESIYVSVSFSIIFAPEKITILQMDADNILVSRTEYEPDAVPKTTLVEQNAAYLIVETQKRDHDGNRVISREIYDSDIESIAFLIAREDSICEEHRTKLTQNQYLP